MKVLWFSNIEFSNISMSSTGTWLIAMLQGLKDFDKIKLYIITKGKVKTTTLRNYNDIEQWIIPDVKVRSNGLPSKRIIKEIQNIVFHINPDIIHIWGTEYYWSRLTAFGYIQGKVLLEMQGLISAIAEKVTADLSIKELIQCIGIKEIIKPSSSIFGRQKALRKRGEIEKDIIARHQYINTQSEWMRAHIAYLNPHATVYKTAIGLRSEFLGAQKWKYEHCEKNSILTITSTLSAYKGLHTLIKAFAKLVKIKPEARLYIAGPKPIKGIRQPGYERYLMNFIKKEDIGNRIIWLGPLNTMELISQILKANVVINPSFIESYSLVLKESLYLGAPTIASYAGAMPELAIDNHSALYYPSSDIALCCAALLKIISSTDLATVISQNALRDNMDSEVGKIQYNIYQNILEN